MDTVLVSAQSPLFPRYLQGIKSCTLQRDLLHFMFYVKFWDFTPLWPSCGPLTSTWRPPMSDPHVAAQLQVILYGLPESALIHVKVLSGAEHWQWGHPSAGWSRSPSASCSELPFLPWVADLCHSPWPDWHCIQRDSHHTGNFLHVHLGMEQICRPAAVTMVTNLFKWSGRGLS